MIQKKVCLLGPSSVGKTSLVKQFVEGIFSDRYLTSIGVKVDKKAVQLASQNVLLMLWDIEGVDQYCGFQPRYLRGASAIIIVTDLSRPQSLIDGIDILEKVREVCEAPAVLAINKSDLEYQWQYSETELKDYTRPFVKVFNTSAKTGQEVDPMFEYIARMLVT